MELYANDYNLFGYNLNEPASPMKEWVQSEISYEVLSPGPRRKFCAFCDGEIRMEDGEISVENENCDECLFQTARERDSNILGYINMTCHILIKNHSLLQHRILSI